MIGIHSPEFERERDLGRVRAAVERHEMAFPHMVDNDFVYWKRLNNRYWPAFYLVDRQGFIRLVHIGETHSGTPRARNVEDWIEQLLDEPPA